MISKKVAMKTPEESRFGKLVAYLLDPQGKKTRVGEVTITNCVSTDTTWAVREIAATQRLNTRAKSDRTYHLLVSLRAGENPDAQTLRVIEESFCTELGYAQDNNVFTHRRSLVRVKASSISRHLAKPALEDRLGTFIPAEYQQEREEQGYEKRPRFGRVDTSCLWEEYQAQRELHKTLRQAKLAGLAINRAQQFDAVSRCIAVVWRPMSIKT
jgi:hypothetical protein